MPSSSTYAAPLSIDLEPSRFDYLAIAIGLGVALLALALAELPLIVRLGGALLALLVALRALLLLRARPAHLLLLADGTLTLAATQTGAATLIPLPAVLIQAAWWGPIPHLQLAVVGGPHHALALFPDRLDANSHQRLRVWLATHRPNRLKASIDSPGLHA